MAECYGEAHKNPYIDNCPVCLSYGWGWIPSPKPSEDNAGLITSSMNKYNGQWTSVYLAKEAGLDGARYMTVCEEHNTMLGSNTKAMAIKAMSCVRDWCTECRINEEE